VSPCPCGRTADGRPLDLAACCGPLLDSTVQARTCEQLTRSRYTAFVLGDGQYLWRTWHPRTRPTEVETGGVQWTGLRVLETVAGGPDDAEGVVAYEAEYRDRDDRAGAQRERARFARRGGRWMYLDGEDG